MSKTAKSRSYFSTLTVTQNELATTSFIIDKKVLISVYKGRAKTSLILEHLTNIANFYKSNEVHGSIVDLTELFGSFAKVFKFMTDTYYPNAVKSGLKSQIFVYQNHRYLDHYYAG